MKDKEGRQESSDQVQWYHNVLKLLLERLPFYYFCDSRLKMILFPSLLHLCKHDDRVAIDIMNQKIHSSWLSSFKLQQEKNAKDR